MTEKRKRTRPLSPRNTKTLEQAITLRADNHSSAHGWILLDDGTVIIAQQASGEEARGIVKLPRGEFNRLIDWYEKEQPV